MPLDRMFGGMGNMATDLQNMGFNMALQGQRMYENALRNARVMGNVGPGERTFTTHDGGQGRIFK